MVVVFPFVFSFFFRFLSGEIFPAPFFRIRGRPGRPGAFPSDLARRPRPRPGPQRGARAAGDRSWDSGGAKARGRRDRGGQLRRDSKH